jgi:YbbR domain-containing protein
MPDLFIKDWKWKLFSLLLAALIWLTIHHNVQRETRTVTAAAFESTLTYGNLPVLVVSTAADVREFRITPTTVTVKVAGSADNIAKLQASQIRAVVDLTDIESTKELVRQVDVSTPVGITLISVDPLKVGVIVPGRRP